jgi:hypothetical protein
MQAVTFIKNRLRFSLHWGEAWSGSRAPNSRRSEIRAPLRNVAPIVGQGSLWPLSLRRSQLGRGFGSGPFRTAMFTDGSWREVGKL